MIYVFDNSALSILFKNYYQSRFPSLWERFDEIVQEGRLISTREVRAEIEDSSIEKLRAWANENKELFTTPTAEEGEFVARIFAEKHFQQNIERKKIMRGGRNADPFIIAKAKVVGGTVVANEVFKRNAAKIPNICDHFGIPYLILEQFMEAEDWTF